VPTSTFSSTHNVLEPGSPLNPSKSCRSSYCSGILLPRSVYNFAQATRRVLINGNSSVCYQRCGSAPIRPRWSYVFVFLFFGRLSLHARSAIIQGTVNDPTPFPTPSRTDGSHHWAFERLLSASLVPLTAAAFVTSGSSYPILDGVLGVSLVMHSHLGVRSVHLKCPNDY